MNRHLSAILLVFLVALLCMAGAAVLAQNSADFSLDWYLVGSGGGRSSSADYQVQGTVGQSGAGQPDAKSADFSVSSGYWVLEPGTTLYVPVVSLP